MVEGGVKQISRFEEEEKKVLHSRSFKAHNFAQNMSILKITRFYIKPV